MLTWFGRILGKPDEASGNSLQAVDKRSPFGTATDRATLEVRRYACICSVYVGGEGNGTGVLVGPDLVLTNHHVVADKGALYDPSLIQCRFGFFDDDEYAEGRLDWIPLRVSPEEAFPAVSRTALGENTTKRPSIELADYREDGTRTLYDYALLRLKTKIGELPGRSAVLETVRPRGWIRMQTRVTPLVVGEEISVVQHPQRIRPGGGAVQEAMMDSQGIVVGFVADGARAQHNASTRHGSSGGAVLDRKLQLVGLHNAGYAQPDGTVDNRMIPIDRILEDVRKTNRALHDEIVRAVPAPLENSRRSDAESAADSAEIDRRITAAKLFLDREREHVALLTALKVESVPPVQVNHVICQNPGDEVRHFIRRLKYSAATVEGLQIGEIERLHLLGSTRDNPGGGVASAGSGNAFVPWKEESLTWPSPGEAPAAAKSGFRDGLDARNLDLRTIISLTVSDLDQRNEADERAYMEALSEACREYVAKKSGPGSVGRQIQAVVVYTFDEDAAVLPLMKPLWQVGQAPQGCGVSIQLMNKLNRGQLQPWNDKINQTWFPDMEAAELLEGVKSRDLLSMRQVVEVINDPIAKAAIRYLKLSPLLR